jgi:hypothetical protein
VDKRGSRLPSAAEIVEINRKHLIDTPLKPADLLFVFGTREERDEIRLVAARWAAFSRAPDAAR